MLNAHIPTLRCYVRLEFLHNLASEWQGRHTEVDVIGVKSKPGRVLGFHVLLRNGAVFWDVPIHGLCTSLDAQKLYWGRCQAWDCFSADVAVTAFERLRGLLAVIRPRGRKPLRGLYHCTFDWTHADPDRVDTTVTDHAAEHKAMHLLLGEDGNLYLQPNNRLAWKDPAFVVEPFPAKPTYQTNTFSWSVDAHNHVDASDDAFAEESPDV